MSMIKLKINDIDIQAAEGESLLEASAKAGFRIPTMCHNGELEHFTSCMICVVKEKTSGKLFPSCTARAMDGMDIITDDEEISEARKLALELLLSEHAGDCEAPCRVSCPAFMDIPLMNRLIAAGQFDEALEVVMKDIALPGVLGRICPAPCEGACKRKPIDEAVSICLLKRATADLTKKSPVFKKANPTGKRVAIIGAGPAGLSAAFYLQLKGVQAVIYDKYTKPGGALMYAIADEELDKTVLAKEIENIEKTGVEFHPGTEVDADAFKKLRKEFDAVVVATGDYSPQMDSWGLENNGRQVAVQKGSYLTNLERVFAVGNVNRSVKMAIRSAAQGKEVVTAILQLFNEEIVTGEVRKFNSTLGRLLPEEFPEYLKEGSSEKRQHPVGEKHAGFDKELAQKEAARCLHCDCRKPDSCKLRDYAGEYQASKKRFSYTQRKPLKKVIQHDLLVYEPGKCIKCGICVRLTAKQKERFGLTFIGRGFDVEIGVPFGKNLAEAFEKTAKEVVKACPTGALAGLQE
jgi:ferredoxin